MERIKYSSRGINRRDAELGWVTERWHFSHEIDANDAVRGDGKLALTCAKCQKQLVIDTDAGTCSNDVQGKCQAAEPQFLIEDEGEIIGKFTLDSMVEVNKDCPDLVEWLIAAEVGDQTHEIGGTVTRIS